MGEYSFLISIGIVFMLGTMSPGPSFILVATTAVSKSKMQGFGVTLGLAIGAAIFALLAIFGLYAILQAVPSMYVALKALGGAYLLYLAYKMWKHASEPMKVVAPEETNTKNFLKAVLLGLTTQLSNPKTAIIIGSIFAALLPNEIPVYGEALLCLLAFTGDIAWYSLVVLLLSTKRAQHTYLRFKQHIDRLAGGLLGLLGIKLVID
ncbi:Lysine exporter protein (LYSE/YGGA) [Paraglaciecola sp. T6c]|uniref:LysE family translocator n=1 Tax=Pseudoalteromonas atlantica (strain T6c / ATCC BAA-1087) TaxID=3042615 RepID=UPI00005C6C76|nr:LysE family transporter [Paraglaciecola sp. T6c]ABG41058.1 Lysine exporter protein (LYSE/YGGA) [Paraglaciecola sp. T6c]